MYADIFGTMPIAEALVLKGTGIGTVLTFMMGVTAEKIEDMSKKMKYGVMRTPALVVNEKVVVQCRILFVVF